MSLHTTLRRTAASTTTKTPTTFICTQCRHATLLRRPKRPYTFTQLITLSDGSTFTHRTTSPLPTYQSARDTRNSLLWNPSSSKLLNLEDDEAGRLAAFRAKYGRSWDANTPAEGVEGAAGDKDAEALAREIQEEEDNLLDLITGYAQEEETAAAKKKK
ncbi:Putative 50S ribosomal protein L36 [Aspergillus calidoustus]|uniref:Putative 50S ribosomal protein L36 n=1 Tax=Aspergillus calidoustus TaxID=454130 RepID=A0A0U5GM45_ASPCI|nr:Putative 50S ribosomal protein L36 [Aspergillus calidoustus]